MRITNKWSESLSMQEYTGSIAGCTDSETAVEKSHVSQHTAHYSISFKMLTINSQSFSSVKQVLVFFILSLIELQSDLIRSLEPYSSLK